jgi:hypothetical protein
MVTVGTDAAGGSDRFEAAGSIPEPLAIGVDVETTPGDGVANDGVAVAEVAGNDIVAVVAGTDIVVAAFWPGPLAHPTTASIAAATATKLRTRGDAIDISTRSAIATSLRCGLALRRTDKTPYRQCRLPTSRDVKGSPAAPIYAPEPSLRVLYYTGGYHFARRPDPASPQGG